jgi:glycosyltransferase 2 family protein
MKTYLKVALLLIVLACLFFFIRATDWSAVMAALHQVGLNFLILLFTTFVSAWLGALGWRFCLPKTSTMVSSWQLFWIRQLGENVAILNPASMIGGEAAKMYMLRNYGVSQRVALHSIVLSRGIMIISQIVLLLIAVGWFLGHAARGVFTVDFDWPTTGLVLTLIVGVFLLIKSLFFKNGMKSLLHRLRLLHLYRNARQYIAGLWQELQVFYRENRRAMLLSYLCCSLHWIMGSLEFYFILLFLGVKTTVAKALLVDMGVIVFKSAGGFIPGQIGIEEYGNKVMLSIIGIAGSTIWITASILRRARQMFWIVLGLLVYLLMFRGRKLLGTRKK